MSQEKQFPKMVADALKEKDLKAAAEFLGIKQARLEKIALGSERATLQEVDAIAAALGLSTEEARRAAWADVARPVTETAPETPKRTASGSYGPSKGF